MDEQQLAEYERLYGDQACVQDLVAEVRRLQTDLAEMEQAHDLSEAMLARIRAASPDRDAVILADVLRTLRIVCEEYGDTDWPDDLHPSDVIEKHLVRPLAARLAD